MIDDIRSDAQQLRQAREEQIHDSIVSAIYRKAENLAAQVTSTAENNPRRWDSIIDDIVTSRILGFPLMLLLLGGIFWFTVSGADYPSDLLAALLFGIEKWLSALLIYLDAPQWLHGFLVLGTYRGLAWVIAVMLPPMAIFFPVFTLLEDLGYLPRIAFNLDRFFRLAGAHGKQALTMAMGFGCNAAGVIAARIIDSPRERLIAILTNNFVPCNGRFPILIAMAALVAEIGLGEDYGTILASAMVVGVVLIGISLTLVVSWALSRTVLKGESSSFVLELPPYRKPQILKVLIRSLYDRTLFVLWRAIMVAAPAGAVTWVMANTTVGGATLIAHAANFLDPLGRLAGLDGVILLSFILGLPANEIVIPIMLMSYLAEGAMLELGSLDALRELLVANGWTWLTAVNFMIVALMHFPCGTTLLTIRRETASLRWTALAAVIPTVIGLMISVLVTQGARFWELI